MISIFTQRKKFSMKHLYKLYFIAFALLLNFYSFAQPGSGGNGPGGPEGGDPEPLPIDSTIVVLGLIGVLYILNVYRKRKTV